MAKRTKKKKLIVLSSGQEFEVVREDGKYYYTQRTQFRRSADYFSVKEVDLPKTSTTNKGEDEGGTENGDAV